MKVLFDLRDMLEDEIKKITKKGELDVQSVELAYKMIDIYKDIETICAMKNSDMDSGYARSDGAWSTGSYGMPRVYDDGFAMRRDSMGRYTRGYSRSEERENMIQKLERMLKETTDENVRRSIQKSINDLKEQ